VATPEVVTGVAKRECRARSSSAFVAPLRAAACGFGGVRYIGFPWGPTDGSDIGPFIDQENHMSFVGEVVHHLGRNASVAAEGIIECIRDNRLDEAQTRLEQLHDAHPPARELLVLPVALALARGHTHDAWQLVNGLPDDQSPELKAICLKLLGDPTWHGFATAHEDSADPFVRNAMRHLLGMESQV
jgi:type III secretion protein HrpB1